MKYKNIGINILRILLTIGIIGWMLVIFGFSSADGETSQSTSDIITEMIVESIYKDYNVMATKQQQEIWDVTSFIVRKTGHLGEYAILAALVTTLLLTYDSFRSNKRLLVGAVIGCSIYAVTDELHQGLVAGRSPRFMDVCIDSIGALCGTLLVAAILYSVNLLITKNIRNLSKAGFSQKYIL